jgi:hypothetical protein
MSGVASSLGCVQVVSWPRVHVLRGQAFTRVFCCSMTCASYLRESWVMASWKKWWVTWQFAFVVYINRKDQKGGGTFGPPNWQSRVRASWSLDGCGVFLLRSLAGKLWRPRLLALTNPNSTPGSVVTTPLIHRPTRRRHLHCRLTLPLASATPPLCSAAISSQPPPSSLPHKSNFLTRRNPKGEMTVMC